MVLSFGNIQVSPFLLLFWQRHFIYPFLTWWWHITTWTHCEFSLTRPQPQQLLPKSISFSFGWFRLSVPPNCCGKKKKKQTKIKRKLTFPCLTAFKFILLRVKWVILCFSFAWICSEVAVGCAKQQNETSANPRAEGLLWKLKVKQSR